MTATSNRPTATADRQADLNQVLANPPAVHGAAPGGVWKTALDAYEFLAAHLPDDAVTLEPASASRPCCSDRGHRGTPAWCPTPTRSKP